MKEAPTKLGRVHADAQVAEEARLDLGRVCSSCWEGASTEGPGVGVWLGETYPRDL